MKLDAAQIAQRALNTPLLIEPKKAQTIFGTVLLPRIVGRGGFRLEVPQAFADDDDDDDGDRPWSPPAGASILGAELDEAIADGELRGFAVRDGVAVIGICGTLVHRGAWLGKSSGITSYEGLAAQVDAAARDPGVRAIALEIDSFGGEVAGCFDLADRIRKARAAKPVRAFLAEHACSAGYALASQADRITIPRTGLAGSIGVVQMHVDWSGALSEEGIVVTLLHAGAHKVDGNPFEPLPKDVANGLNAELQEMRALFAATVAAGRGDRLSAEGALETEARCFMGAAAVAAGIADAVAEPRAAFEAFVAELDGRINPAARAAKVEESGMKTATQPARRRASNATASRRAEEPGEEEEDETPPEGQQAEGEEEEDEAAPEGKAAEEGEDGDEEEDADEPAAAKAERKRIAGIMRAPEAAGRDEMARHFAFDTRTSVKAARAAMATAPAAAKNSLAARMAGRDPAAPAGSAAGGKGPRLAELAKARFARA